MTTTRSWAASTSEPATQRRSETHRAGGACRLGYGCSSFTRYLGLVFGIHPIWSSLLRESLRTQEARMRVGPRGASLPTRDTRVVHPMGKAGPGDPWHRDQRENYNLGGKG